MWDRPGSLGGESLRIGDGLVVDFVINAVVRMDPALDYSCRGNPAFWISAGFDRLHRECMFGDFLENEKKMKIVLTLA